MAVSEAPRFGHNLKDIRLDEGQSAHFETTLTPVNDASMKVFYLFDISKRPIRQPLLSAAKVEISPLSGS